MNTYNKFAQLTPIIEQRFAEISGIPNSPHPKLIETAYPISPVWDVSQSVEKSIIVRQQSAEVAVSPTVNLIGGGAVDGALAEILNARRVRFIWGSTFQSFSANGAYDIVVLVTYRWEDAVSTVVPIRFTNAGAPGSYSTYANLFNTPIEVDTRLKSYDSVSGEAIGQIDGLTVIYTRTGGGSTLTLTETTVAMDLIY